MLKKGKADNDQSISAIKETNTSQVSPFKPDNASSLDPESAFLLDKILKKQEKNFQKQERALVLHDPKRAVEDEELLSKIVQEAENIEKLKKQQLAISPNLVKTPVGDSKKIDLGCESPMPAQATFAVKRITDEEYGLSRSP